MAWRSGLASKLPLSEVSQHDGTSVRGLLEVDQKFCEGPGPQVPEKPLVFEVHGKEGQQIPLRDFQIALQSAGTPGGARPSRTSI